MKVNNSNERNEMTMKIMIMKIINNSINEIMIIITSNNNEILIMIIRKSNNNEENKWNDIMKEIIIKWRK